MNLPDNITTVKLATDITNQWEVYVVYVLEMSQAALESTDSRPVVAKAVVNKC